MSRKHKEDVKKETWRHAESVPKSLIFNAQFKKFPPRWWNAKLRALGELTWPGFGGQVGVKLRPSCLEVAPSRLLFLVSNLNLAPSSRLRHLSIRSSLAASSFLSKKFSDSYANLMYDINIYSYLYTYNIIVIY